MVKIIRGNLIKQNTEGIINPIHADVIFDRGIPFFIKKNGGDTIEKEAMRHYPSRLGNIFTTDAGKLSARKIIHLVNREFAERTSYRLLQHSLAKAILTAHKLNLKSLSIPPIYNRFSPKITAHIFWDGIQESIQEQPEVKNMEIFVVIFDKDAFSTFQRVFQENLAKLVAS